MIVNTFIVTYRWTSGDDESKFKSYLADTLKNVVDLPLGIKVVDPIGLSNIDDKRILLYVAHSSDLSKDEMSDILRHMSNVCQVIQLLKVD